MVAIRFPLGSEKYLVRALPLPRDLDKFSSGGKFISLVIYFLPKKIVGKVFTIKEKVVSLQNHNE